jgi:hypothetical protein
LDIRDHTGDVFGKVYQRVLNEREVEKARLSALRATREMRLRLRDEESDESAAVQENLLQLDKEHKIAVIMLEEMPSIYDKARQNMDVKLPKPPGTAAKLEEVEEYEAALDEYNDKVTSAVTTLADGYSKELRQHLEKLPDEELDVRVTKAMENQICINFMSERFNEEIVWRATFHDAAHKKPFFTDYDEYENLALEVREQLERGYKDLQMHRGELKN